MAAAGGLPMDRRSIAFFGTSALVLLAYLWLAVKYRLERGPGRRIGPLIRKTIAAIALVILVGLAFAQFLR